jgi:hypothetical protein
MRAPAPGERPPGEKARSGSSRLVAALYSVTPLSGSSYRATAIGQQLLGSSYWATSVLSGRRKPRNARAGPSGTFSTAHEAAGWAVSDPTGRIAGHLHLSYSPANLLTRKLAHPQTCSPADLLTRRLAHPQTCSPADLLTRRLAHQQTCSSALSLLR